MDDRAPPPSYDEVTKGSGMPGYNPPPEGFPPGPPGAYPYPPAGYGQGVPPAPSAPPAFPPPQHAQPLPGSGFPQCTNSTVAGGAANQPYQYPVNQAGSTTTTVYQHPTVVASGPFPQTGAPVGLNQNQQAKKFATGPFPQTGAPRGLNQQAIKICVFITALIIVFIIIVVFMNKSIIEGWTN